MYAHPQVGDALAALLQRACAVGTEDGFRAAVASTLGAYAPHCSETELNSLLSGPVGPLGGGAAAGAWEVREGAAMLLAAVGRGEAGAKLEEAGLLKAAVEAAVKFSKDPQVGADCVFLHVRVFCHAECIQAGHDSACVSPELVTLCVAAMK